MIYLIERIATYLVEHGPSSTVELAKALDETSVRVGDALKASRTRGRWGITRQDYDTARKGRGAPPTVWAIDKATYKQHMDNRRPMPWVHNRVFPDAQIPVVSKRAAKREARLMQLRKAAEAKPKYTGPMLTRWLPCSPYAKAVE